MTHLSQVHVPWYTVVAVVSGLSPLFNSCFRAYPCLNVVLVGAHLRLAPAQLIPEASDLIEGGKFDTKPGRVHAWRSFSPGHRE